MFHVKPTCPFHFITFTKTKWLTRRRSSVSVRTWNMTLCSCTSSCVSGGSPRLVPTSSPSCKAGIVWSACTSLSSFIRDGFVNADRVDWRGSLSVLTNYKRFAVNVAPNCDLTQQFQAREFVEASGTNQERLSQRLRRNTCTCEAPRAELYRRTSCSEHPLVHAGGGGENQKEEVRGTPWCRYT